MAEDFGVQEFQIDAEGYALIIGLVEERIQYDIRLTREALSHEQQKSDRLGAKPSGMINNIRKHFNNNAVSSLGLDVHQKETWLCKWRDAVTKANPEIESQRGISVKDLIHNYQRDPKKRKKLYLILQEAILIKLYGELEGVKYRITESDTDKGADYLGGLCGYPAGTGEKVLHDTDRFIKDTGNSHNRLVKYALGGALFTAITVGFAAPHIGAAVGATVFGLHGAAATTAGLALLGGGALAAHGLGIAGGFALLVGGGAVLGAATGAGVSKIIQMLDSNPEIVAESMARVVNYVTFLSTGLNKSDSHAKEARERISLEFLRFKHSFETEVISSQTRNPSNELKAVHVIGHAYNRIVQELRAS